jgi:hypothetical protein
MFLIIDTAIAPGANPSLPTSLQVDYVRVSQ